MLIEAALQGAQGGNNRGIAIKPVEEDRLVGREIGAFVGQDNEIIFKEFGIGGIGIHQLDLVLEQSSIGQSMVHPPGPVHGQTVVLAKSLPTIFPAQKAMTETDLQIGIPPEIGNGGDVQTGGNFTTHGKRIGIDEPQLTGHAHTVFLQDRCHLLMGHRPVMSENHFFDGTGIGGKYIDLSGLQGLPENRVPSQSRPGD